LSNYPPVPLTENHFYVCCVAKLEVNPANTPSSA